MATYVGDEFLTLYHCIRSLAVKEPFPDARDNLILLLETVKVVTSSSFVAFYSQYSSITNIGCCYMLIVILQNRSSDIHSHTRDIHFNFFKPSERCTKAKSQSSDDFSYCNVLKAEDGGFFKTNFWSLFVRVISFFFIKSRCLTLKDCKSTDCDTI